MTKIIIPRIPCLIYLFEKQIGNLAKLRRPFQKSKIPLSILPKEAAKCFKNEKKSPQIFTLPFFFNIFASRMLIAGFQLS
jgi:hypothetical protein